jgi:hypothetical protein
MALFTQQQLVAQLVLEAVAVEVVIVQAVLEDFMVEVLAVPLDQHQLGHLAVKVLLYLPIMQQHKIQIFLLSLTAVKQESAY